VALLLLLGLAMDISSFYFLFFFFFFFFFFFLVKDIKLCMSRYKWYKGRHLAQLEGVVNL
jgi:hypothetical protein